MPINPTTVTPIMEVSLISGGLIGPSSLQMATGLANGLTTYVTTGIIVQSIDIGTLGAGTGTGLGVIVPPVLVESMIASFIAHGIIGIFSIPMATAVATGFMESFLLGLVETVSAGVGVGVGEAFMIPNSGVSIPAFISGLSSAGMVGPNIIQLASAVAQGLDQVLPISMSTLVIAGPPNILPGAGTGTGKIL